MFGKRLAGCAGTAEHDYTIENKPTPDQKSDSSLPPKPELASSISAATRTHFPPWLLYRPFHPFASLFHSLSEHRPANLNDG